MIAMWYLFQEALMWEEIHLAGEWMIWHWVGMVPILIAPGWRAERVWIAHMYHGAFMGLAFSRNTSNGDAEENAREY
jgi:hypothetical protein